MIEAEAKWIPPNKKIHDRSLSWLGTSATKKRCGRG